LTRNTCEKCDRKITRSYGGHDYCEIHYLQLDPDRNAFFVMATLYLSRPSKTKEVLEILHALLEFIPLRGLDEYYKDTVWYQKLRKEGKFP
jgi:hypothetical protein